MDTLQIIIEECNRILETTILSITPVQGGDINEARLLHTHSGKYFLKYNKNPGAEKMFQAEALGLSEIQKSKAIAIPRILHVGKNFLLLEFIESNDPSRAFWKKFGNSLARLHQQSQPHFGWKQDNFIGSLHQQNGIHQTWEAFYIHERLQPQIKAANSTNLLPSSIISKFEKLYQKLPDLCPDESPALIHGDLWSGNFICATGEKPVFIDPSVSYAHREMDLAMSKLFGGFAPQFYESYQEVYPCEKGLEERLPVYQLYYLLVHVNIFGKGYVQPVNRILDRFV